MSSIVFQRRNKGVPEETSILDDIKKIMESVGNHPQLVGILLCLAGSMVKSTHRWIAQPVDPTTGVIPPPVEDFGADITLVHVTVGDVENTIFAPLAAIAGFKATPDQLAQATAFAADTVWSMIDPFANAALNPAYQAPDLKQQAKQLADSSIVRIGLGDALILGGLTALFAQPIGDLLKALPAVLPAVSSLGA